LKILEEKQSEIEKEKNRIKNGKETQEAKKLWEQKTRDREETLKRKEKEDEKKAKEKIKAKIEQDRLEREAAKKKSSSSESNNKISMETSSSSVPEIQQKKRIYGNSHSNSIQGWKYDKSYIQTDGFDSYGF